MAATIRAFAWPAYEAVLNLWRDVGFTVGPSETRQGIALKLERDPELFLVADIDGEVVGAVLGAFDGRRGWIYHLAVAPAHQRLGVGRRLLAAVEQRLSASGCLKVNLLIDRSNADVAAFYGGLGYAPDDLVFMAKWLDTPAVDFEIVDGLATGRDDDVRQLLFEYMAATEIEAGPPCASPEELAPPLRAELQVPRSAYPKPGTVLIAEQGPRALGCLGIRLLYSDTAELKRLYVRPAARGSGVARRLMLAADGLALSLGIHRLMLDVLPRRVDVIAWYRRLGYGETEASRSGPFGLVEFERILTS